MSLRTPERHVLYAFCLVYWLVSWSSIHALADLKFVIEGVLENEVNYEECQGQPLMIGCTYRDTVHQSDVTLTTGDQDLPLTPDSSWQFALFEDGLSYTVPAEDATGTTSYSCNARSLSVSVTIQFDEAACSSTTSSPTTSSPTTPTQPPSTDPTTQHNTPSTKTDPPTTDDSGGTTDGTSSITDTSSSGGTTFKGLKPLIYTVASVILLGTLAIVAIITCWIRARRSFHSRIIRPNDTPQDYLDYISDNEFTPLTTSEFLASLQERPPTYNQSEEMTQQTNPDEATPTDTPTVSGDEAGRASSGEPSSLGPANEGAVVERRRRRGGSAGRERQRRRRRVVIVESGDTRPEESSVTVTSTEGGVTVTYEEEGGVVPRPLLQLATPTEGDEATSWGGTVTVEQLVPLELPVPNSAPSPSHKDTSADGDVDKDLPPPPISEHQATPPPSRTLTSDGDREEVSGSNLIDFSAPPLPPAIPEFSDF